MLVYEWTVKVDQVEVLVSHLAVSSNLYTHRTIISQVFICNEILKYYVCGLVSLVLLLFEVAAL